MGKTKGKKEIQNDEIQTLPEEAETTTTESVAREIEPTAEPESKKDLGTRKIKMLKVVCRAEGTFLPGRVYEVERNLADIFVKNCVAEKAE